MTNLPKTALVGCDNDDAIGPCPGQVRIRIGTPGPYFCKDHRPEPTRTVRLPRELKTRVQWDLPVGLVEAVREWATEVSASNNSAAAMLLAAGLAYFRDQK